jgi:PAS domain S-box-containing protein
MARNSSSQQLAAANKDLRARLERAEESVREILSGEADALFVPGANGAQLFTLAGADQSYRTLIEQMSEGALTLTPEGLILYANRRFSQMLGTPLEKVIGSEIHAWFVPESRQVLQTLLQKDAVANRSAELLLAAADGMQVPVYLSVSRLLLDKMPDSFCMVATDLTEQKRNKAILAAEEFARAILEQAADAIVICDRTGRIIRASKQAQAFCGENSIGRSFEQAFPLRYFNGVAFSPIGAIDTTHRQSVEARLEHGGRGFDLLVSVGHLTDARSEMLGSVVTLTDITERKLAEKALSKSEEEFRTLANSIPQLAWMARADGFILWYNQRWYDYTGTTPEQMEGWGWQSVHDPAALPSVLSRWRDAIALEQPFEMEFPLRGADGTLRNFLTRVQPIKDSEGHLVQWFGTNTDVDQLKRIEQSLRVTQARLESTLEVSSVGTWTWDIPSDRLIADEFTARMFSIAASAAAEGLPAAAYLQVVHEEDRTDVADALDRAIRLCGAYDIEYRVRQSDGALRWLQARGRVESDGAGHASYFHGAVIDITDRKLLELSLRDGASRLEETNRELQRDITERKRVESALQKSEFRYHTLFSTMVEGFCVIEVIFSPEGKAIDFRYLEVNPAFYKQTGMHDMVGKRMREIYPVQDDYWFELYGKIVVTGEPAHVLNEARALNGFYDIHAYRIGDPELRQVAIISNDISELKLLDETPLMTLSSARIYAESSRAGTRGR